MKYGFKNMTFGDSIFIPNQTRKGSAFRCAMHCKMKYGLTFQSMIEKDGIRITCTSSNNVKVKTKYQRDEDMVKAMVDWGLFPDIMSTRDVVRLCRKAIPDIPKGKAGKLIGGKLIAATGKYKRVRVYNGKKQLWLSVRNEITVTGARLWYIYETTK